MNLRAATSQTTTKLAFQTLASRVYFSRRTCNRRLTFARPALKLNCAEQLRNACKLFADCCALIEANAIRSALLRRIVCCKLKCAARQLKGELLCASRTSRQLKQLATLTQNDDRNRVAGGACVVARKARVVGRVLHGQRFEQQRRRVVRDAICAH